ncbi:MAG: hypothetical protein LBG58_04640 [Planctomycetaceae bacterium]|nr:hypothetical protein [Planctomycetaceae bacterium]
MANSNGYVPRKENEFLAWAKTIYGDCEKNLETWGLDLDQMTRFAQLIEIAGTAFQVNSDKERKNKMSVYAKNAAFLSLKQFLKAFINTLEGNLKIPDEAITSMGLRPRRFHARQPIPVPTEVPVITPVVGQHHNLTVYAATLQLGHPTESLKIGKYAGFLLKYRLEDETQWQFVISTKLHYTLVFDETAKGKHLLMQGAWLNPRMQNGPWSEEIQELVN